MDKDSQSNSIKILLPVYDNKMPSNTKGNHTHKCELCGKGFQQEYHLKTHIKIHNGEKPFQCTYPGCYRKFNQFSNLSLHEKSHKHKDNKLNKLKQYMKYKPDDEDDLNEVVSPSDFKLTVVSNKPLRCTITKKMKNSNDYALCGILTNAIPNQTLLTNENNNN